MESIPSQILDLVELLCLGCGDFRHIIVSTQVAAPAPNSTAILLTYQVPDNFTFIVENVRLHSIPPVNDPSLTVGDWRSEDFDASGGTMVFFQSFDGQNFLTPPNVPYFAILNEPILLAFAGGSKFNLMATRPVGAVPTTEVLEIAISGFLANAIAFEKLAGSITIFEVV